MFLVERALLVINRTAGVGHGEVVAERLGLMFDRALAERTEVRVELVRDHLAARPCAAEFVRASDAPAVIIAGRRRHFARGDRRRFLTYRGTRLHPAEKSLLELLK